MLFKHKNTGEKCVSYMNNYSKQKLYEVLIKLFGELHYILFISELAYNTKCKQAKATTYAL